MVIELSGVQFGQKSYAQFQNRTSAQCWITSDFKMDVINVKITFDEGCILDTKTYLNINFSARERFNL